MKIKALRLRKPALLILLLVLVIITMVVWFSLRFTGENRKITALDIRIKPDSGVYFFNRQDVSDLVTKWVGNPMGKSMEDIALARLESGLKHMPQVASAQVYVTMDGKLRIKLDQRYPILRVLNTSGESYYIDSLGMKIPFTGNRPPDVLVANGFIPEKAGKSDSIHSNTLHHLVIIARYIHNHPFWNAEFEQCYVDNLGDIILVPRTGNHSIVLGTADNLDQKMENLRIFYEKALNNIGWDKYKIINLKYRGQIIGVRSGNESEHIETQTVQNPQH